ncbi:hypothetical protein NIIDNTM18_42500 [Mycolicibacterium litorale]|uniref:Uncharacterized protein n=1 Tax=Mycolicibacterium litorale TaxID=758802 RepID=A0A6S6PA25_9MYCO|nr:hypothetical protein [Mycolicibacterium litorale]BCI54972.1 hypothetical protein NIIDNTM18_42500 [Mycolicibacterium litorale]
MSGPEVLRDRLAELLYTHRLSAYSLNCQGCAWSYTGDNDHNEHVAEVIEAEIITTYGPPF